MREGGGVGMGGCSGGWRGGEDYLDASGAPAFEEGADQTKPAPPHEGQLSLPDQALLAPRSLPRGAEQMVSKTALSS